MKQFLSILLLPIFLLTTSGVAITTLYCQGKISGMGVGMKACCKDVNKGGCCATQTKIVKLEEGFVHQLIDLKIDFLKNISFLDLYPNDHQPFFPETFFTFYWDESPPFSKEALYILFLQLII